MPHLPATTRLPGLKIIALATALLITAAACGDNSEPAAVGQSKSASGIPRLDRPGTFSVVIAHEAEFDGKEVSGRQRRFIALRDILPGTPVYFSLSPQDAVSKRATKFVNGYSDSLMQDLEMADEFCSISLNADHCLLISLNYRPCLESGNCEHHTVAEATMAIFRSGSGELLAVLAEQFSRPADREAITGAVDTALQKYMEQGRPASEIILTEITLGLRSDKPELIQRLNRALTNSEKRLDDPSLGEQARGDSIESLFEVIDKLFVWPTTETV